jgi:hypothetical protein
MSLVQNTSSLLPDDLTLVFFVIMYFNLVLVYIIPAYFPYFVRIVIGVGCRDCVCPDLYEI